MKSVSLAVALAVASVAPMLSAQQATEAKAKHETQAQLRAEAKITKDSARKVALAEVPNGKIKSAELEREQGKLIYSFDVKVKGKKGVEEVTVDAVTGQMVAHTHESAAAEKKEAAGEVKEKKGGKKGS